MMHNGIGDEKRFIAASVIAVAFSILYVFLISKSGPQGKIGYYADNMNTLINDSELNVRIMSSSN